MSCLYPNQVVFSNDKSITAPIKFFKRLENVPEFFLDENYFRLVEVPCGKCVNCKLDYARQWSIRCELESYLYPKNYNFFITLTYSDDFLTRYNDNATLVKKEFSLFLKRLREYFRVNFNHTGIRFFGCGEYGSKTMRPHYHSILFNCPLELLNDFKYYSTTELGFDLFTSETLNKIWSFGYVVIGEYSYQSAGYVARYVSKKVFDETPTLYDDLGIEKEFSLCSRRPGIARGYFDLNREKIFNNNGRLVLKGGKEVNIPHYFDLLIKGLDLDFLEDMKLNRQSTADLNNVSLMSQTDLNEFDYNDLNNRVTHDKLKLLNHSSI